MTGVTTLFLFLAIEQASLAEGPAQEESYSEIERELDRAQRFLVNAQTYTCQSDRASEAYARVQSIFDVSKSRAEVALGRETNLRIWVNSCRDEGDSLRFRSLLNRAQKYIRKANRLIDDLQR